MTRDELVRRRLRPRGNFRVGFPIQKVYFALPSKSPLTKWLLIFV